MVNVEIDGKVHRLRGRAALMVAWLAQRKGQLETSDKMSISFNCAGASVRVEHKKIERADPALLR
jgi:hypothetical protein